MRNHVTDLGPAEHSTDLALPTRVVTHDVTEARMLGERILVLEGGHVIQLRSFDELQGAGPSVRCSIYALTDLNGFADRPARPKRRSPGRGSNLCYQQRMGASRLERLAYPGLKFAMAARCGGLVLADVSTEPTRTSRSDDG